ncbi:MAG: phosphatase PAP2 family protein [Chlamydiales bacterium]
MKQHLKWLLPIFLFGIAAPFTPTIDLYVSEWFYAPSSVGRGTFYNNAMMQFLFRYGEIFGFFSGGAAGLTFVLSFLLPKFKKWRQGALACSLTLLLGAGIITNSIFKQYWGRPRPKQIVEFGGHSVYRPFWRPDFNRTHEPQKSFPSGHVAMGFYFLSLCLAGRRYRNPLLFKAGLFFTLALGGGLMLTRVAQGGHFVSDVLASALLMWLVALIIDALVFRWGEWERAALYSKQRGISQEPDELSKV